MDKRINASIWRLNYMISETNSVYHKAAEILGLSDSALTVLYSLCSECGSCKLSSIYKLSGMPKQTVNSAVRKMEADKLLYLENTDGKSKKVILTEAGKELAEKTALRLINAENRIAESWNEEDMELFIRLNQRYAADLRKELENL